MRKSTPRRVMVGDASGTTKLGFIYVAEAKGRVKVGWAVDPARRMKTLPFPTRAVAFKRPVSVVVEKRFHIATKGGSYEWYCESFEEMVARVRRWFASARIPSGYCEIDVQ